MTAPTDRGPERGAVAVMIAIMALLLVTCIAFAVDLGYAWQVRRSMVKATDASALAAAREARDWARLRGNSLSAGQCAASANAISTEAETALTTNRAGAEMDFCAIADGSNAESGVLTVRGSTDAELSFAGVIGKDSIAVHSSTSVRWKQPKILPLAICMDAVGNNNLARWLADPATPYEAEMRVSESANSRLCSSGGSGYWGALDLASSVTSNDAFDACRSVAEFERDWLDLFDGRNLGSVSPRVGEYFCGAVGVPDTFTTAVDRALCQLGDETDVVVPIITEPPNFRPNGNLGKTWIVRVGGYAVANFTGYSGVVNNRDLCSNLLASGPLNGGRQRHHRPTDRPRRRFELARTTLRKQYINGKANVSALTPASSTVSSGSQITFTATISNYSPVSLPSPEINVTLPAGATMVSGCTRSGNIYVCGGGGALGTASDRTLTFTASFTASGSVSATLACSGLAANGQNSACSLYRDTGPATAQVTIDSSSGNKTLTTTLAGTGDGTVTLSNPAGTTCTTATSPCVRNYSGNNSVTLSATAAVGSRFVGWSGACTGTGTCTVSTQQNPQVTATFDRDLTLRTSILPGTGSGSITSRDGRVACSSICQTTYTSPTVVVLDANPDSISAFGSWSGDCQSVNGTTCTVDLAITPTPLVSATFVDDRVRSGNFRELSLRFNAVYRATGTIITDITSYRICAVDVKSPGEALLACKP